MRKIAFVFPGQGSQKVGMGREMAEHFRQAQEIFAIADETLGFSLSSLCWDGPEEELRKTVNTQPAILAMSIACYKAVTAEGIEPFIVAGHSVGEYAALVAAGALNFHDALKLVRKRGELMHAAGESSPGTMAAIIGMDYDAITEACEIANAAGVVEIANFNTPEQTVISGEVQAVERAIEIIKGKGAKRVAPLNVSAAFHSSLMKSAAEELSIEFDRVTFRDPLIPVVVNISAEPLTDRHRIKEALKQQILGNVMWVDTVKTIISRGADTFVEIGPGKALCGMIKKIDKYMQAYNVEDKESFIKATTSVREELCLEGSAKE
jgi:[acyl-carrier-protein] S-malonyltransferase